MMPFIKTFLRKENISVVVFLLLFLSSCKQDRTTQYLLENKADSSIRVYTTALDSVFEIASNTSQTLSVVSEFVGKEDAVAENFLYSIDSIKKEN